MKRYFSFMLLFATVLCTISLPSCTAPREKFSDYSFEYFDTVTTVTGYAESKEEFDKISHAVMSELREYHRLFTVYNRYDDINNLCSINTLHGDVHIPVKVDRKIIDMLLFCKDMYAKTGGKVNVAMGSVLSIWHDYRTAGTKDPSAAILPPMERLQEAAKHTDINNIIINEEESTVFLSDPEMLLDVGAIAKGYAVEMAAQSLIKKGISGYVINVGGNVRTIGYKGNSEPWGTGIENPDGTESAPYYEILALSDMSLVTSGSYQRYYIVNGKNYNHVIDKDTLMPADRYTSVSIVCESSAVADALSTALFCMSIDEGKALLDTFEGAEALWVTVDGVKSYSDGFSKYIMGEQK